MPTIRAQITFSLLIVLLLLPSAALAESRLWKIEAAGTAPSHLLGTMHVSDPKVTRLPDAARAALDRAQVVAVEVVMDQRAMAEASRVMFFDDGHPGLGTLLDDYRFDMARAALVAQGVPPQAAERLKPWAVYAMLSVPPQDPEQVLDTLIVNRARAVGKPVAGLETIAEQFASLDDLPPEVQLGMLRGLLDNLHRIPEIMAETTRLYLAGDLDGLLAMSRETTGDVTAAGLDAVQDALLDRRNRIMAGRMMGYLAQGNAFIAVGALHLPGERGLIALLRGAGYRVTPVR